MKNIVVIYIVFFFIGVQTVLSSGWFLEVVEKNGSCPARWSAQGNYCVGSSRSAKPIVAKYGSCPAYWTAQGNYCVAGSNSGPIIPKFGSCPAGWSTQGKYCVY